MSKLVKTSIAAALLCLSVGHMAYAQSGKYPGIGRDATPAEVKAWDIDVRPDFKGLPQGSGSVSEGQVVWDGKCAACHGSFAESNDIFTPLVGGTTKDDIKTGRVASLQDNKQPHRTTMMRLSTVSTLWDFIYRAMPWNAPRSLTVDQTFAVVAYILNLAEVVPDDFVLTDKNIAEVQKLMPNRNGMVMYPGLWHVKGKPDVNGGSCMTNCVKFVQIGSQLPPEVRNAQGNLADQNRTFGPFIGVDTTKPPLAALPGAAGVAHASAVKVAKTPADLFKDNNCSACHAKSTKLVGPATDDVAAKYKGQSGAEDMLVKKVKNGGSGVWGSIPMPPQSDVPDETLHKLVHYVLTGE